MQQGMISRIATALSQPSANMSWAQLGAATVFVIAVALMWRQVTMMITEEA